jgi:hypothetical protein
MKMPGQKSSEQNGANAVKAGRGRMKGRVILALSLTVNFGLLALQLSHRSKPPPNPVVKVVTRILSPAGPGHSPPPAASAPVHPPVVRWSRIESQDYHAYIANLRAIGCPEPTIRDIIYADVSELFVR